MSPFFLITSEKSVHQCIEMTERKSVLLDWRLFDSHYTNNLMDMACHQVMSHHSFPHCVSK